MKVALFEGPERLVVQDMPLKKCDTGDIIIKIYACGICGGDVRNFHNGLRHGITSQVMGHEFSGVVHEVGTEVNGYKTGDRIAAAPDVSCGECYYCRRGWVNLCNKHKMIGTHWPGGFAEFIHIPAFVLNRGFIHHIPEGVSMKEACLSEPASSVIAGMERAQFGSGDSILILGDGPIGCLHIEVARALSAAKIIISGNLRRLESLEKFHPDRIIDAGREDVPGKVREFTNGLGVDLAICANPVAATQEQAVQSLRKRGRAVLFGGVPKSTPMTTLNSNTIHYDELEVVGAFSYETRHHLMALEAIRTKTLNPELYFTRTVSLDNINEGFMSAGTGKALKTLVIP